MIDEERKEYYVTKQKFDFHDLTDIMTILRAPGGCPWDAEQTHKSIRQNMIEETYEVVEAIDTDDAALLREELGDVLMQVVFHAEISKEEGNFDIGDVIDELCHKLIQRHPHVFGEVRVENADDVLANWTKIKEDTKHRDTETSRLRAIPAMLPALMRAQKVGKKASFFDFADAKEVYVKICEELGEIQGAAADPTTAGDKKQERLTEEVGDLLLCVTSLARKLGVDSEIALTRSTDKFIRRFEAMENICLAEEKQMRDLSQKELDALWDQMKERENS